ncbi:MAG: hypothetical protein HOY71_43210, partial [Nonomuraea sp.]|nr:hypothetical protein [Nonomuraea sp.]
MSFTDAAATCPLPLTAAQLGVWYAQRFGAGPSSYNLAQYVELRGPVSPELLETAIHRAERECGSFDLRFTDTEDGPRQLPLRPAGRRLRSLDLRGHADP